MQAGESPAIPAMRSKQPREPLASRPSNRAARSTNPSLCKSSSCFDETVIVWAYGLACASNPLARVPSAPPGFCPSPFASGGAPVSRVRVRDTVTAPIFPEVLNTGDQGGTRRRGKEIHSKTVHLLPSSGSVPGGAIERPTTNRDNRMIATVPDPSDGCDAFAPR